MPEIFYFTGAAPAAPAGTVYVAPGTPLPVQLGQVPAALADALANPVAAPVGSFGELYNGASWDMQRNNAQGTLLASAARTAQAVSPLQTNFNARGVVLVLNVSVAGTGGLTMLIQEQDPVSGSLFQAITAFAQVVSATTQIIKVYPGLASNNTVLSRNWRIVVQVGDASSWTYSVGYCYIN